MMRRNIGLRGDWTQSLLSRAYLCACNFTSPNHYITSKFWLVRSFIPHGVVEIRILILCLWCCQGCQPCSIYFKLMTRSGCALVTHRIYSAFYPPIIAMPETKIKYHPIGTTIADVSITRNRHVCDAGGPLLASPSGTTVDEGRNQ